MKNINELDLDKDAVRTHIVMVRLNEYERRRLMDLAGRIGCSKSGTLRALLTGRKR